MPHQDTGEPALQRQTRKEIVAETGYYEQYTTTGWNFPNLGNYWIHGTIYTESNGHPTVDFKFMCMLLATHTKLFAILAPGDKVWSRVNLRAGNQTTSWLFNTGAAVTCMSSRSFNMAFGQQKPWKVSNAQSCMDAMNSIGVYKVYLLVKGRKFTHPVNVTKELNDNIIGINFYALCQTNMWCAHMPNEIRRHLSKYHLLHQTSDNTCNDLKHNY